MARIFKYLLLSIVVAGSGIFSACESVERSFKSTTVYGGREFPEVADLSEYPGTAFVPTLEHEVPEDQNVIYASSFLFAWNEVKKQLQFPVEVSESNSQEFKLITSSNSFLNSLSEKEYSTEVSVEDGIVARAFFHKGLPFSVKFHTKKDGILFRTKNVRAFGLNYQDHDITVSIQILYYKNDSCFVLKLLPEDQNHEIILAKGIRPAGRLIDYIEETRRLADIGSSQRTEKSLAWKYTLNQDDKLAIPVLKFNLETQYKDLEGQTFTTNNKPHELVTAFQRTAFLLDEFGAEVESEAAVTVDSIGAEESELELPHPKILIYDEPFLVILKRTDSDNPYFVMTVRNDELMVRND